jgi:nucleotide-binding universal stress UspA family protein
MSSERIAFKHILVATDFGEPASHALDVALALAEKVGATVTLVHVHYIPPPLYDVGMVWPTEQLAQGAQRALDAAVAKLKQRHPACHGLLRTGSPATAIVTAAKERHADLVVMGTHGRRGVSRTLMGSVAEQVVRTSPMPVLTVSLPEHDEGVEKKVLTHA